MNNEILAKIPLRIEVISPIHIGTEVRLNNKSFAVQGQKVYMADENKILSLVNQTSRLQAEFEKFCLEGTSLTKFLTEVGCQFADVTEYTLDKMGVEVGKNIFPFIKLPTKPPTPYLPGSSLKGALRSVFLRARLLTGSQIREIGEVKVREQFRKNKPKSADDALEEKLFGKDQHHEWLRLLQITDSRPVKLERLKVAEIRTFSSTRERQLGEKTFILSPEVLIPKTVLHSTLVINQYLTQEPAESELKFKRRLAQAADFATACNKVAEEQIAQEIRFFEYHNHRFLVDWYKDLDERRKKLRADRFECLVRLGWGTGYDNKTISDIFSDDMFNDIRNAYELPVGRPGRTGKPLSKLLSPKSRKLVVVKDEKGEKQLQPLGWLLLQPQ